MCGSPGGEECEKLIHGPVRTVEPVRFPEVVQRVIEPASAQRCHRLAILSGNFRGHTLMHLARCIRVLDEVEIGVRVDVDGLRQRLSNPAASMKRAADACRRSPRAVIVPLRMPTSARRSAPPVPSITVPLTITRSNAGRVEYEEDVQPARTADVPAPARVARKVLREVWGSMIGGSGSVLQYRPKRLRLQEAVQRHETQRPLA